MKQDWKPTQKPMPYRVPSNFFSENEGELLRAVEQQRPRRTNWWIAAAASLIVATFVGLWSMSQRLPEGALYPYSEELADEELASWVEFYEADLFLSSNYQTE